MNQLKALVGTYALAPGMVKRGSGDIVNLSNEKLADARTRSRYLPG